jgi:peroxiredoxin
LFFYNKYRVAPSIAFDKLNLQDTSGSVVTIGDFKGKKLIVSFGASWCVNCIEELNTLKKISDSELSDMQIVVISDEGLERIKSFQKRKNYPFIFLKMDKPFQSIGINSIPTTYIFNRNLQIKLEKVGYLNWEDPSFVEHTRQISE